MSKHHQEAKWLTVASAGNWPLKWFCLLPICLHTPRERDRQTDTARGRERQTDRHSQRERDRQTQPEGERQTDTARGRETDRHSQRERDRQTYTARGRETHTAIPQQANDMVFYLLPEFDMLIPWQLLLYHGHATNKVICRARWFI